MTLINSCPPINGDGFALVRWINILTSECVYGSLSAASWLAQYVSVAVWVYSGAYQCWLCYKTKQVSGFSEYFLLCWIVGAVLNTLGCFLTDQMGFQKFLGVYFLFSDSMLYFQYKYYIKRPHLAADVIDREKQRRMSMASTSPATALRGAIDEEATIETTRSLRIPSGTLTPGLVLGVTSAVSSVTRASGASLFTATASTAAAFPILSTIGYVIGNSASWLSNSLYVISRIPQIRQNHARKATEGVSPALFIAVLVGNAAYTLAVTTAWQAIDNADEKAKFMVAELPFIVGGAATTLADLVIFVQMYLYRNNTSEVFWDVVEGVDPKTIQVTETSALLMSREDGPSKKVMLYDE